MTYFAVFFMGATEGSTFNTKFYKEQYELNNNNLIETIYNKKLL